MWSKMKPRFSNKLFRTSILEKNDQLYNYVSDHEKLNTSVDYPVCKDMKSTSDEIEERIFRDNEIVLPLL